MKQIINSILDTDLYKLTMNMAVLKQFPRAKVTYEFINRSKTKFPEGFADELRKQIKLMENLELSKSEKTWLNQKCYYLDPSYTDFLYGYRFDSSEVGIIQKGDDLQISIEGYWHSTILWEVPLMAIISELYFRLTGIADAPHVYNREKRKENNVSKAKLFQLNGLNYADFGTRRRYSFDNQDEVINDFVNFSLHNNNFSGTSNVYLAFKHNLTPIGTHAHEWFMFHAAKYGYKMANSLAMEHWVDVYRGDLGIALSDTFTTDAFLKSFDKKFAKLFDGVRHDSGDPIVFADKIINHYKSLRIDPTTKTIVFSDALTPEKAVVLNDYCRGKIRCSFGIGTNFTNDVGVKPLNMVIKMISAKPFEEEWTHTIKLSDDKGKYTGNEKEIEIAKYILNVND